MNPNNQVPPFSTSKFVTNVPFVQPQSLFRPSPFQNQNIYIPPNFPSSLLPSLQQHLSLPNSPLNNRPSLNIPLLNSNIVPPMTQQIKYFSPLSTRHQVPAGLIQRVSPQTYHTTFEVRSAGLPSPGLRSPMVYTGPATSTFYQIKNQQPVLVQQAKNINTKLEEILNKKKVDPFEEEVKRCEDIGSNIQSNVGSNIVSKCDLGTECELKTVCESQCTIAEGKSLSHKDKKLELFKKRNNHRHHHHHHSKDYDDTQAHLPYFKEFLEIYESCLQTGKNFIDQDFQPNVWSLIEKENSVRKENWSNFIWSRPKDFLEGKYYIFHSENDETGVLTSVRHRNLIEATEKAVDIDDIVQGELGDCYFLSSLSSLAENPYRIRNLFLSKRVNENCGVFCLKMCHEGEWRTVYVDDYFPAHKDGSGLCFSKSKKGDNELWVPILEKAWAKLYGNYERIEAGLTRDVLRDLTGAPTKVVWTDDPNLWNELLNGEAKDYIMTAGAIDAEQMKKVKMHEGMVVGHAYSLISVSEVLGQQLVRLRNPWGSGEWQGAWSDEDPNWKKVSEEEKKDIGYNDEDDGCFFMALDDFRKIYGDVQICMVEDENKYDSITLESTKKKGVYVEVEVPKNGDYCFTVLQRSLRKINSPSYDYGKSTIIVAKRENDDLVFVDAKQIVHRENFVYCYGMKEGNYVIYCKVNFEGINDGSFVLSCYGDNNVFFKQIPKEQDFLEKVYLSKARKSSKVSEFFPNEGYGYYCFENKVEKAAKKKITLKKIEGLRLKKKISKDLKENSFEIIVPGKSRKAVIFRVDSKACTLDLKEEEIKE